MSRYFCGSAVKIVQRSRVADSQRRRILFYFSLIILAVEEVNPMSLRAEISLGELIDKITILRIKQQRFSDPQKSANVINELATLEHTWREQQFRGEGIQPLIDQLQHVNEQLWEIEDDIRDCERRSDFGEKFIELARSVYKTNDRRAELKRQINELTGSRLKEEKSYQPYE